MGSIPFAFSVHHFISSVGADAGFASIVGLAILVLLYFAQARETANLREQAYEAGQRVQQLENRLAQLSRQGTAAPTPSPLAAGHAESRPAPVAAPRVAAAAGAAASARAVATAPAPPAGVAAPALTAATKLIPTVPAAEPESDGHDPDEQRPDATVIAAPPPAPTRAPTQPPAPTRAPTQPPAPVSAPATVAAGANGSNHDRAPAPRALTATSARRPPAAPPRQARERGGGTPRAFMVLISALVVVAIVAVLLIATSGGGGNTAASNASLTTNAPGTSHAKGGAGAPSPSSVTVAVLNGTDTSDLAHRVAAKLDASGYRQGAIATASDQTHTATIVGYTPGHRASALAVAGALHLGSASVQPADPTAQAVACPPPSTCSASVIVTVGSDLASSQ